uniref:G-protein coupled receptors family 1 profile domain-containing protein n=1 Tax=Scleropages formosus TaxID=113540 RepID=A0A8C9RVE1_SCLFO
MDSFANDSKCEVANKSLYMNYSWIIILELILGQQVFLFNLVLADFLLLTCLPMKVYQFQRGERCSKSLVLCKAMFFTQFMNRGASIAFMTIITTDRYLSMVHPKRKNILKVVKQSSKFSIIKNCCLCCLRLLYPASSRYSSVARKKTVGEQDKLRRAVFAVTAVVVVYSICFLPHAASRIVLLVERSSNDPKDLETAAEVYEGIFSFSQIDCLLDTLVYCFYSSKFKNAYLSTFFPCFQAKYNKHNVK